MIPRARLYAARHQLEIAEPAESLGSGKDGIILVAKNKGKAGECAVKALKESEAYLREKRVYERLQAAGVRSVMGFNVPQFLGCADDLRVVEMTIVQRPFVLDFAGAHLDTRPEFAAEIWSDWEVEKREQFERRWPTVEKILAAFEEHGIYLLDVSPGNVEFLD
ncbi:MAG: hypothetical protein KGR98_03625 [Verrucomicrobia bacterium]|nr:hypothetical protein [Verrucomicrobiota bacterium]